MDEKLRHVLEEGRRISGRLRKIYMDGIEEIARKFRIEVTELRKVAGDGRN